MVRSVGEPKSRRRGQQNADLNAGHKPVKVRHQLELLFLYLLPSLRAASSGQFILVEKRKLARRSSAKVGSLAISILLTLLAPCLSLLTGKPVAPSTGLIKSLQDDETELSSYAEVLSPAFLNEFVSFLASLDRVVTEQYGNTGALWMGREVSLASLSGAVGAEAVRSATSRESVMRDFLAKVTQHPTILNLAEFEQVRNSVDLSKVNIGNINRKAIFAAMHIYLLSAASPTPVDWYACFRCGSAMKPHEILYDWPVTEITRLADSDEAEAYANGLPAEALQSFTVLTEQMRALSAELFRAKGARSHSDAWDDLGLCLEQFQLDHGDFPDAQIPKFRLFVLLADRLAQSAPTLDAPDIDADTFEVRELPQQLPFAWFSRENQQSPEESLAILSHDIEGIEEALSNLSLSPPFVFCLLGALHGLSTLPTGSAAFVKRSLPPTATDAVEAFAKMAVLSTGTAIHSARRYTQPPRVLEPDLVRVGHEYQQWGEVLDVLSEYNSRDEVVVKYPDHLSRCRNIHVQAPDRGT